MISDFEKKYTRERGNYYMTYAISKFCNLCFSSSKFACWIISWHTFKLDFRRLTPTAKNKIMIIHRNIIIKCTKGCYKHIYID